MLDFDYIGFDLHKKWIVYCVKAADGTVREEDRVRSLHQPLREWAAARPRPWIGAMEATLFTGWVYDTLKPYATRLEVAHPAMLKMITAAKKKNDQLDAAKISDLLRCNLLPSCYMMAPELRELRRILRYRNLIVGLATRMRNKMAGLLLETGAPFERNRLRGKKYFERLLTELEEVPASVIDLLRLSRSQFETFRMTQQRLLRGLEQHPELRERVELLQTIPAVGPVLSLTWALEVGDPKRFQSIDNAISYCGLCSAQRNSAGHDKRGPISKQRNAHLQTILTEVAKMAPHLDDGFAALHARELRRGHRNRATLAVARKLVSYLLAVDRRKTKFEKRIAA